MRIAAVVHLAVTSDEGFAASNSSHYNF